MRRPGGVGEGGHLHAGTGRWRNTPEGLAARHLHDTRAQLQEARWQAKALHASRRDRRTATRTADHLTEALSVVEQQWRTIGQPTSDRLEHAVHHARGELEGLELEALRQQVLQHRVDPPVQDLSPAERMTRRLDRIQSRGRDQDFGLGL